jgi:cell division septum initiation protein DivIVA
MSYFTDEVKRLLKEIEELENRIPHYQGSPRKQDIVLEGC